MTINNQNLGTATSPTQASDENDVLGKLVNHNTTEESFQESLRDVAVQVDRDQQDIGYNSDPAMRDGRENRSINTRLDTVENALGISDDNMGAVDSTMQTLTVGGGTGSDISGPLSAPQINPLAVGMAEIATGAVTSEKIADGTIVTGDISATAGITRTQLETDLQTYQITTGTDQATAVDLGSDITIPRFATDQDGVAQGPTSAQTTSSSASGDIWVLGSDNNWYQLNSFARQGQDVPASRVATTTTSHSVTAAVPMGTSGAAFLALAANRMEGSPPTQFGLENGDIISLTDTTPTPDQIAAYVYIGPSLIATADGTASDFVQIGQAETYGVAANGGIEFQTGTNNFQLTSTIPGNRTFSGNTIFSGTTTHTGTATFNGDVDLGDISGADVVSIRGTVDTNIIPNGNPDIGRTTARWNAVYAGTLDANTITGPITDANIQDRAIDQAKINPDGSMTGHVLTSTGPSTNPEWMAPPIGVEMVATLPTGAVIADYPFGVLVSLTATDGDNAPGIYRQSSTTGNVTWTRLGTVGAIVTKTVFTSVNNQTQYTPAGGTTLAPAHLLNIDGLTLVEGTDYTVAANRTTFTLTTAVSGGRDIELINFSDVAAIGTGEIATTALAGGSLPSGVTIGGSQVTSQVSSAGTADAATNVSLGDASASLDSVSSVVVAANQSATAQRLNYDSGITWNGTNNTLSVDRIQLGSWVISESNGQLIFADNGVTRFRMDTNGHFRAENDITAFDSL